MNEIQRQYINYTLFKDMPTMNEMQRQYITYVLEHTNGKMSGPNGACSVLGMKRTTLYGRMKALGWTAGEGHGS